MSEIKVINGEIHSDARGFISSLNSFRFDDVQRVYFIHHPDTSVVPLDTDAVAPVCVKALKT